MKLTFQHLHPQGWADMATEAFADFQPDELFSFLGGLGPLGTSCSVALRLSNSLGGSQGLHQTAPDNSN